MPRGTACLRKYSLPSAIKASMGTSSGSTSKTASAAAAPVPPRYSRHRCRWCHSSHAIQGVTTIPSFNPRCQLHNAFNPKHAPNARASIKRNDRVQRNKQNRARGMNCSENRFRCSRVCSIVWGKYAKTIPASTPASALPVSSRTSRYVPKPVSVRANRMQKL